MSFSVKHSSIGFNTPAMMARQIGSQCILWLDADTQIYSDTAFTSGATNGGTVGGWKDQSLLGNHCTQATPGSRPAYATNTLNGHSVVTFTGNGNGTGQILQSAINEIGSSNGFWAIAVLSDGTTSWSTRAASTTAFYSPFAWNANDGASSGAIVYPCLGNPSIADVSLGAMGVFGRGYTSGNRPRACGNTGGTPSNGSYHVFSWICGDWSTCRRDGADMAGTTKLGQVVNAAVNGGTGVLDVGGSGGGFGSRYYNGNMASLIAGIGQPSIDDIHRIELWLGIKYAITVS